MAKDLLKDMMAFAVPLHIDKLKKQGGPCKDDMEQARATSDILGARGDVLLCGGGKPGEAADQFNRTAHAIAVLAFAPGGVTAFGQHYEAIREPDEFVVG